MPKDNNLNKDTIKISPTSSLNSDRDGFDDARKINNGKTMGDSDDENMSGFESDSEDENHQNRNGKDLQNIRKF